MLSVKVMFHGRFRVLRDAAVGTTLAEVGLVGGGEVDLQRVVRVVREHVVHVLEQVGLFFIKVIKLFVHVISFCKISDSVLKLFLIFLFENTLCTFWKLDFVTKVC